MLKRLAFLTVFMLLPTVSRAADGKDDTKKFLIFNPGEAKGQYIFREVPKTVSSAPRVTVEIKKDKSKKSEPEADAPAEVKTEVKPVQTEEKNDDDDF